MNPTDVSYRLRFGPYHPPTVKVGDEIQCEIRGLVIVAGWSDRGAIMWPMCRPVGKATGRRGTVLMGDLVLACITETELAVAKHWGVSLKTVMLWKRALKAPARTPGTDIVSADRSRENMTGRIALPQTRMALLRAAKRPKSEDWKRRMKVWIKRRASSPQGSASSSTQ